VPEPLEAPVERKMAREPRQAAVELEAPAKPGKGAGPDGYRLPDPAHAPPWPEAGRMAVDTGWDLRRHSGYG